LRRKLYLNNEKSDDLNKELDEYLKQEVILKLYQFLLERTDIDIKGTDSWFKYGYQFLIDGLDNILN